MVTSAWALASGALGGIRQAERLSRSAEEIIAGWVEREGLGILMAPPMEGFSLTGWFGPGLAIVAGLVVLRGVLLVWRRRAPGAASAPAPIDPAYRERIARELDRIDEPGRI
jgi:cytochrome c-type biogenesis protein CcmH/NrfF